MRSRNQRRNTKKSRSRKKRSCRRKKYGGTPSEKPKIQKRYIHFPGTNLDDCEQWVYDYSYNEALDLWEPVLRSKTWCDKMRETQQIMVARDQKEKDEMKAMHDSFRPPSPLF
jgi:hypothetical protein